MFTQVNCCLCCERSLFYKLEQFKNGYELWYLKLKLVCVVKKIVEKNNKKKGIFDGHENINNLLKQDFRFKQKYFHISMT